MGEFNVDVNIRCLRFARNVFVVTTYLIELYKKYRMSTSAATYVIRFPLQKQFINVMKLRSRGLRCVNGGKTTKVLNLLGCYLHCFSTTLTT